MTQHCAVQAPKRASKKDHSKRREENMRDHLDRIAAALAAARAAGAAAGAAQAGLGYGAAWPAPLTAAGSHGGKGGRGATAAGAGAARRGKATVRNAERPPTPTHAAPPAGAAAHRAAALLQRLLRGRAIQVDVQASLAAHAALIDELMAPAPPVDTCPLALAVPAEQRGAASTVAALARNVLRCVI